MTQILWPSAAVAFTVTKCTFDSFTMPPLSAPQLHNAAPLSAPQRSASEISCLLSGCTIRQCLCRCHRPGLYIQPSPLHARAASSVFHCSKCRYHRNSSPSLNSWISYYTSQAWRAVNHVQTTILHNTQLQYGSTPLAMVIACVGVPTTLFSPWIS